MNLKILIPILLLLAIIGGGIVGFVLGDKQVDPVVPNVTNVTPDHNGSGSSDGNFEPGNTDPTGEIVSDKNNGSSGSSSNNGGSSGGKTNITE